MTITQSLLDNPKIKHVLECLGPHWIVTVLPDGGLRFDPRVEFGPIVLSAEQVADERFDYNLLDQLDPRMAFYAEPGNRILFEKPYLPDGNPGEYGDRDSPTWAHYDGSDEVTGTLPLIRTSEVA